MLEITIYLLEIIDLLFLIKICLPVEAVLISFFSSGRILLSIALFDPEAINALSRNSSSKYTHLKFLRSLHRLSYWIFRNRKPK